MLLQTFCLIEHVNHPIFFRLVTIESWNHPIHSELGRETVHRR